MRPIKILGFLVFVCVVCLPLVGGAAWALDTRTKYATHGFNYAAMPDFETLYGIQRDVFVSRTSYSGWTDDTNLPPTAWYDNLAASYSNPHNLINIDIESWPVDTQADRLATAHKLSLVYQQVKARRPELQISFYAWPHVRDLYRAITAHDSSTYLQWQAANNDFAELWANIDWIAPSFYWFYNIATDGANANDNYGLYLTENIAEVHRCRTAFGHGQPIIPYISPFRAGNAPSALDTHVWTTIITRVYQETDGWLLWTGQNAPTVWDENAWWWINVKHYLPSVDRSLRKARNTRGVAPAPVPPRVTNRSLATAVHLGTSITWTHPHGASINSAVVASVSYQDSDIMTWTATATPGGAMTLIANNQVSADGVAAFILTNPPAGPISITISAGATTISDMQAFAISLQGVNQLTPTRSPYAGNAASGLFGLTVVNSVTGDLIVACDVVVNNNATVDTYQDATNTVDNIIGSSFRSGALSTTIASGSNTTVQITQTSSTWRGLAFAVIPYGGS